MGKVPQARRRFEEEKKELKQRLQQVLNEYDEEVVQAAILDMLPGLVTEAFQTDYLEYDTVDQYLQDQPQGDTTG